MNNIIENKIEKQAKEVNRRKVNDHWIKKKKCNCLCNSSSIESQSDNLTKTESVKLWDWLAYPEKT